MAYVIKITETFHSPDNNRMVLSCMNSCKKKMQPKYVHNSSEIQNNITQAAKSKQQLDADVYARNVAIEQSAKARKNIK